MLFVGIYLILVGLIGVFGISISPLLLAWIALIAGVLVLFGDHLIAYARRV